MPLVQVTMVRGRTIEQKHALIASVSEAVAQALSVSLEQVRVAIYEVSPDEWGIGGRPYSAVRGKRSLGAGQSSPEAQSAATGQPSPAASQSYPAASQSSPPVDDQEQAVGG